MDDETSDSPESTLDEQVDQLLRESRVDHATAQFMKSNQTLKIRKISLAPDQALAFSHYLLDLASSLPSDAEVDIRQALDDSGVTYADHTDTNQWQ